MSAELILELFRQTLILGLLLALPPLLVIAAAGGLASVLERMAGVRVPALRFTLRFLTAIVALVVLAPTIAERGIALTHLVLGLVAKV